MTLSARIIFPVPFLAAMFLAGCATPAAHQLVVAAHDYEARSTEAIAAVETMARRELQPTQPSERDAEAEFVDRVMNGGAGVLGPGEVTAALRPYEPNITEAVRQRAAILDRLRADHAAFTAIFADVERAGLLGKRTIATRVPPVLDILIAQQVAIARSLQGDGRPLLLARRSELITEINRVRRSDKSQAEKEASLRELRRNWLAMEAEEADLLASTSHALLTAAAVGLALRHQAADYGHLSVADLQAITTELVGFVGAVTGRDLTKLNGQVEAIAARIEADPDFSAAAKRLLDAAAPPPPQTAPPVVPPIPAQSLPAPQPATPAPGAPATPAPGTPATSQGE
jgi:hypothetical protein